MSFDIQNVLLPIVLLPIFGALYLAFMGRRVPNDVVTTVAVGAVFGSFLLSFAAFVSLVFAGEDGPDILVHDVYEWFSITVGGVRVPIRVRFVMDHLSGVMAVMVSGISALIHVYSIGYMSKDEGYARFMAYLNLFTASMLILVLASNMPLMFVGWEGVGLCSYLLIGFWFQNEEFARAGKKAFIVNRIGDFGVLIGMFILVSYVAPRNPDAFEFASINALGPSLGLTELTFGAAPAGIMVATAAGLFIFLGCVGKSAQIPLFVWLPDAMAGPTPVSALIHAATMVTAGVYLCCRLSPMLVESPVCMAVIAIVGALTALIAASIALVQNQMKRILAYSTVSQLGFMFAAVGMGAFAGGFFHLFTHAFFKACLFLGAGSVMHAIHAHGDADIRTLGGLRHKMPATHVTFLIATAAIAGLPLLSGFFSKDEIFLGALTWATASPDRWNVAPGFWENLHPGWVWDNLAAGNWAGGWVGWFVFGILAIAAAMTAFYMFRLYFLTFWGEYKGGRPHRAEGDADHGHEDDEDSSPIEPHESPDTMTIPLWVLAGGAAVVGFLGLPHFWGHGLNLWSRWLTPSHEQFLHTFNEQVAAGALHEDAVRAGTAAGREVVSSVASLQFVGQVAHAPGWVPFLAMCVGLIVALLGFGLAFAWYKQADGEVPARLVKEWPRLHRFLMDKWRVDELYEATIISLMKWLGVVAANLDRFAVDGLLTKATAAFARAAGYLLTRAQTGVVYAYAGLVVVGMAGLAWWFTYPHPFLEGEPQIGSVSWSATPGLGNEYRWDFDSDSEWDTEWQESPLAEFDYAEAAYYGLVGIFETPLDDFGPREIVVEPGDNGIAIPIPGRLPPTTWARPDAAPEGAFARWFFDRFGPTPPSLSFEDGAMVVTINHANIPDNDGEDDGRITLRPGESIAIGYRHMRLTVAVRIRGTVEVRNPFGNITRDATDVTMRVERPSAPRAEVVR